MSLTPPFPSSPLGSPPAPFLLGRHQAIVPLDIQTPTPAWGSFLHRPGSVTGLAHHPLSDSSSHREDTLIHPAPPCCPSPRRSHHGHAIPSNRGHHTLHDLRTFSRRACVSNPTPKPAMWASRPSSSLPNVNSARIVLYSIVVFPSPSLHPPRVSALLSRARVTRMRRVFVCASLRQVRCNPRCVPPVSFRLRSLDLAVAHSIPTFASTFQRPSPSETTARLRTCTPNHLPGSHSCKREICFLSSRPSTMTAVSCS